MDGPVKTGLNRAGPESGIPAYRLRNNVRFIQQEAAPLFLLSYPLKALRLHPAWGPAGRRLAHRDFVPLAELEPLFEQKTGDRLRRFLDELVRKGFLEVRGIVPLGRVPRVSVIIPVRNRPEEIRTCLEALLRVDYPRDKLEIMVVDDASSDHTPDTVARFPVTLVRLKEHRQAPFCRNLGARRARGEILAFIDSDCLAGASWLKELVPLFENLTVSAVGGKVDSYSTQKGLDRYERVMSSLNGGDWPRRSSNDAPFFYVPACNLLVRREAFLALGGFREELVVGEDVDLCWRLQDRGQAVEYRPAGTVLHRHRNKLKSFCARRFDYGTSEALLQKKHPRRIKSFGFPPLTVLFWVLLGLAPASEAWPLAAAGALVAVSDAGFRKKRLRRRGITLSWVPIQIAVLRDYLGFLYHSCAFLSRYYLAAGLLLIPLLPRLYLPVLGVQLLAGSTAYAVKRPRLNFLSFQFFFLLEQLAYQSGVWWGCLKNLHFNPVAPKLVVTRVSQGSACTGP